MDIECHLRRSHARINYVDVKRYCTQGHRGVKVTIYVPYGYLQRTVNRVIANCVSNLINDALPANILEVFRVRDDEADFVVVLVVFPVIDSTTDADVLRMPPRQKCFLEGQRAVFLQYWRCWAPTTLLYAHTRNNCRESQVFPITRSVSYRI